MVVVVRLLLKSNTANPALRERIFHSHLIMGIFVTSEAVTLLRRVLDRPTIF